MEATVNLREKREELFAQDEKEGVRQRFVNRLLPLFVIANCGCFLLIIVFGALDFFISYKGLAHQQIITTDVVITIVAATAAQLGAIVMAMGRYYFK